MKGQVFSEFGQNSGFVAELYDLYLVDPSLVSGFWADYFSKVSTDAPVRAPEIVVDKKILNGDVAYTNGKHAEPKAPVTVQVDDSLLKIQEKAIRLIGALRSTGHRVAKLSPIEHAAKWPLDVELTPESFGISTQELEVALSLEGSGPRTVRGIYESLRAVYCGTVGYEFDHVTSEEEKRWLRARVEGSVSSFSTEARRRVLKKIIGSEYLESEIHKKYVGAKRFSVEGGETLIAMMDAILEGAPRIGAHDVVVGMAHRGRLGVLTTNLGKPIHEVFAEFEDQGLASVLGAGDVKYHLGYQGEYTTEKGEIVQVSMAPNPSHLEAVNPVVEGIVRARQDLVYGGDRKASVAVLIHGDAAFIGQGVVPETLNMANTRSYGTGGTLHIVVNNQVGFTTNPDESRSSPYCTDFARSIGAPIIHVNAEDPEACIRVIQLALDYRGAFGRDIVVDLYCYRKYGHNEGDDPTFTQPLMYGEIKAKKPISRLYADHLISEGVIAEGDYTGAVEEYTASFAKAHEELKFHKPSDACAVQGKVRGIAPDTAVSVDRLEKIAATLTDFPEGFSPHAKLAKILEKRVESVKAGEGIEWGVCEGLAFGSLVQEGRRVRLTGQDVGRGTFSHRHLVLHDVEKTNPYYPLARLEEGGGKLEIHNSTLSEFAVMGFEFGYAATAPEALVLWEAQFGDFANGAQIIIDQFLSGSEAKWGQLSGLTLMLPHGYEGQGPEHSSARLERYLQLCAEGNMCVCVPSCAAQHFHMLRRQALSDVKRPLIVMTPKSLLRSPDAAASIKDLSSGTFREVIGTTLGAGKPEHVIFLSGKVYYDVMAGLNAAKVEGVRVIRVEQLYPFPQGEIKTLMKDLSPKSCLWVQEEPQNMGAWSFIEPYFRHRLNLDPTYVGRSVGASTATGSPRRHAAEQKQIVEQVISLIKGA